jgi:hypothetical protein
MCYCLLGVRDGLGYYLCRSYPTLALLGQGLKKSPIGQKLDFANHPYLCKGLMTIKKLKNLIIEEVYMGCLLKKIKD